MESITVTEIQSPARPRRDRARWIAWSACAAIGLTLGLGGVVYGPAPAINDLLIDADLMIRLNQLDAARASVEQVLEREPDHAQARIYLASIQMEQGEAREALRNFIASRSALAAAGPDLQAQYLLTVGLLQLRVGDHAAAYATGQELIEQNIRPAAGTLIQSFSRLAAGDDTGSRRLLKRAFSLDPFDPVFRLEKSFLAEAVPWTTALTFSLIDRPEWSGW